jgi:hypothetical protein
VAESGFFSTSTVTSPVVNRGGEAASLGYRHCISIVDSNINGRRGFIDRRDVVTTKFDG